MTSNDCVSSRLYLKKTNRNNPKNASGINIVVIITGFDSDNPMEYIKSEDISKGETTTINSIFLYIYNVIHFRPFVV